MTMKYINIKYTITLILGMAAILATGCTSTYTPPDYSKYYWPKEPMRPRLRLLNIIRTDLDIRDISQSESMFGESVSFKFIKPHSVVVDKDNNIYVTDSYSKSVFVINEEIGSVRRLNKPGGWYLPLGLGIDNVNNILAVTDDNSVILVDYKTGNVLRVIKDEGFNRPQGIAFDTVNRFIYIVETRDSAVYKYDYNGNRLAKLAGPGTGPDGVYYPAGAALDSKGRLFVVDTMNWKIKIFDKEGEPAGSFGVHGSVPGQFARPKGISISKDDIIAITDNDLGVFMLMDDKGRTYTYLGGNGARPAEFTVPMGIYIAEDDKIYVVDQVNRRLQVFQMYTDRYYQEHPEADPTATNEAATAPAPESQPQQEAAEPAPDNVQQ